MAELSVELIAHILYNLPLCERKLRMQLVSKRFRQAMTLPEAHAATAKTKFLLNESCSPGTARSVLNAMPFVSLRTDQTDFSWVAYLSNLQILACGYGALRPISPITSVRELILDCATGLTTERWQASLYSEKVSLAALFPNLKKLNINGIPEEKESDKFFRDVQRMKLDVFNQVNYPILEVPSLHEAQWAQWNLAVNPGLWEVSLNAPEDYMIEAITPNSASLLTSFTLKIARVEENFEVDLSIFCECSRLERLNFLLEDPTNTILVVNADKLPQTCTLVQFGNFAPYIQGVDGWRWEDKQYGICRNICRNCQTTC